jgi:hypothetical protein
LSGGGSKNNNIQPSKVSHMIANLNRHSAPGWDGITAEHLYFGESNAMCVLLASMYSAILSCGIIPTLFTTGIIIPLLKKPTLNPGDPSNYRPLTLSVTYAKMLEMLMIPDTHISDTQYGFRQGRGVSFGCSLLNDLTSYFREGGSPVYMCSLDAEKCFDKIWHDALFYKLWAKIPLEHWILLLKWYRSSHSLVRFNGTHSGLFRITRGTKQGSLLSPILFNIFLDDLLIDLTSTNEGLCVGRNRYNNFAYADDVTVYSCTTTGLQVLINKCANYAKFWRFKYGLKKTKCFISGNSILKDEPKWFLDGTPLENVNSLTVLGTVYNKSGKYDEHVDNRISACRRSIYGLQDIGMCYPGLRSNTKAHIWKTVGVPTLTSGLDCLPLTKAQLSKLESAQGCVIKRCLGLNKRSHHQNLLKALKVAPVAHIVRNQATSLFHRLCNIDSPTRDLNMYFMSRYVLTGKVTKGTLIANILNMGMSPLNTAFCANSKVPYHYDESGVVDSLTYLVMHEHFIKPYSDEHILTTLLTKSI